MNLDKIKQFGKAIALYVMLPLTLILIAVKMYLSNNKDKANESIKETTKEDQKLEVKEELLKQEANIAETKADAIEEKINNESNQDEDWHKKV